MRDIAFALLVALTAGLCVGGFMRDGDATDYRTAFWEGYFHSAINYRFYLRKANSCPEKAAVWQDFAQQWKQLESRWQNARNSGGWSAAEKRGRLAELKSRADDIEARELVEGYDHELMGKVQDDFEEYIGYDSKTGKYKK
jgi:hypothetical protein